MVSVDLSLRDQLPLGTASFTTLRDDGQIYVDKSAQIAALASQKRKFLFTRPRRFGKTLLVSTFETLFREGLKKFQGLEIERIWKDRTYDVVRIDFSEARNFNSYEVFKNQFDSLLSNMFARCGFESQKGSDGVIEQIGEWLRSRPPRSLVLLIDEYDSPLTACVMEDKLFRDVQRYMAHFFAKVKACGEVFRFFFMTGIMKFSQTGIFSEFNDLLDVTLDPEFGTLLGYTEEELRQYFSEHLVAAARTLQMTEDDLIDRMRSLYDGFCFDEAVSTHVYNPWSVLSFLYSPFRGFQNYWVKSGGLTSTLLPLIRSKALKDPSRFQEPRSIRQEALEASYDGRSISDVALLVQTGYLTIKEAKAGEFQVGFPNEEVASALASLYTEMMLGGRTLKEAGVSGIETILAEGDAREVVRTFNDMFASLDYMHYPVHDEHACRGYLQAMLHGAKVSARIEVHNALGRSDLEVDVGTRRWVFEFKHIKTGATGPEAERRLEEAVLQLVSRRYGLQETGGRKVIRMAMVFSEQERRFTLWRELEAPILDS